jgi:hypothetical protein
MMPSTESSSELRRLATDNRGSARGIVIGAIATAAGILLSVVDMPGIGSWFTVGGLGLSIWCLHRFGRSGPQ